MPSLPSPSLTRMRKPAAKLGECLLTTRLSVKILPAGFHDERKLSIFSKVISSACCAGTLISTGTPPKGAKLESNTTISVVEPSTTVADNLDSGFPRGHSANLAALSLPATGMVIEAGDMVQFGFPSESVSIPLESVMVRVTSSMLSATLSLLAVKVNCPTPVSLSSRRRVVV